MQKIRHHLALFTENQGVPGSLANSSRQARPSPAMNGSTVVPNIAHGHRRLRCPRRSRQAAPNATTSPKA